MTARVDIERLRALHEKATQGEWYARCVNDPQWWVCADTDFHVVAATSQGNDEVNSTCIAAIHNALPAILAELERGRRIEAALVKLAHRADRIGGDSDGMPECPWCHNDQGLLHDNDCDLVSARAALAQPDEKESKDG